MSRPTDYTEEVGLAICERIADGESLRTICSDNDMPGRTTVYQWLEAQPAFANHYARARIEFHRRTGVMEKVVFLQKEGMYLVERARNQGECEPLALQPRKRPVKEVYRKYERD